MRKKYQSEILEAVHEEAQALFEAGAISKERMDEYNHACLTPKKSTAQKTVNPEFNTSGIKPLAPVYVKPR